MKKLTLIAALLFIGCSGFSQKAKVYKNVDTMYVYDNAEIIIYKNKKDTIFFNEQRRNIRVLKADVVNVLNGETLQIDTGLIGVGSDVLQKGLPMSDSAIRSMSSLINSTPECDTIPVIVLVSDTARGMFFYDRIEYDSSRSKGIRLCCIVHDTSYFSPDSITYFIKGYEVRQNTGGIMYYDSGMDLSYGRKSVYEHSLYLDADKKPLSKNIVVWMSQEIK